MKRQRKDRERRLPAGAVVLLLTILTAPVPLQALDLNVHGYGRTQAAILSDPLEQQRLHAVSRSYARLDAEFEISDTIFLDAAYSLTSTVSQASFDGTTETVSPGDYRIIDLPPSLLSLTGGEEDTVYLSLDQELDRLFTTIYLPSGDLYIGRQAISWGSARVIDPTAVFSSFTPGGSPAQEIPGVDAVRLRIPIGMMGELDLGYVFGEHFRIAESAAFTRMRTHLLQTDLTFLLMDVREHLLAALDITRSIGDAGAWLTAALILPDAFSRSGEPGSPQAALTVGIDHTFGPKFYGFAEYHLNTAGIGVPEEYQELYLLPEDHPTFRDGLFQLWGRHYAAFGGSYVLHPLLPVNFLALVNTGDRSAVISLEMEYGFTQDLMLSLGGLISLGTAPDGNPSIPHSEFGMYAHMLYLSAILYF